MRLDTIKRRNILKKTDIIKRGERVRRDNKQFVRNIIIISVVALIGLMIGLFVVLQTFLGNQTSQTYIEKEIEEKIEKSVKVIEIAENKMILVETITQDQLIGYDIKNRKTFSKKILDTAKVRDAYGKVLPITQITKGDIVEVGYQEDKDSLVTISKSSQVKSFKQIKDVTVDKSSKQMNIGGTYYTYTEDTMIIDANGELVDVENLGPFDIVSIKTVDDMIWSIIVEKASASLNVVDLPTQNGQIEINYSRLISFQDITEPIKLIPGTHKIVIKMEGYATINKTLTVDSGEAYEISLADAKIVYTTIKPYISAKITDYTIKVGEETYAPADEIQVPQGEYIIEISAEDYEKWTRKVKLEKDVYILSANLSLIQDDESIEDTQQTDDADDILNTTVNRVIVLNTDPSGAKVYIDGAYKGETPYTITLPNGNYNILFEKPDYMVYSTNILLDSSNDQSSFLYALTLNE